MWRMAISGGRQNCPPGFASLVAILDNGNKLGSEQKKTARLFAQQHTGLVLPYTGLMQDTYVHRFCGNEAEA